ncbi:MAG: FecR domain-containing protein [Bacteroidales bacterium]|nr:FecR domain-containing protein [Bacteroidales bacterium]
MDTENIVPLLAGYFRNELDQPTQEEVEAWIDSAPENREMALQVCRLTQYVLQDSMEEQQDTEALLRRVDAVVKNKKSPVYRWVLKSLGLAAVAALGVFFGSRYFSHSIPFIKFSTGSEVASVILPDQTKVWLNANSTLLYPEAFQGRERSVRLEGEAYFDVTKDANHPFTVTVPDCRIKVLGTQFDVSSFPDSPQMQTTLVSGSVELSYRLGRRARTTVIYPGQRFSMDTKAGHATLSYVDTESLTSWRTGNITFNHTSLSDVLTMIGNTFGIRFVIGDNRKLEDTYTGSFMDQSLEEVLSTLETVTQLHFDRLEDAEGYAYPRYSVY